jgi:hypothetical protein
MIIVIILRVAAEIRESKISRFELGFSYVGGYL